nr:SAM-dependent methyltransferase [Chloroflexota bacterium]
MDLLTFQTLLTPVGQGALAAAAALAPAEETFLPCLTQLQKRHPAALAKAAIETVILRRKAEGKFSRAAAMYFTRAGLEMASGETISRHRAARFAPLARIADLCCGIGGDAIGLAQRAALTLVDRDPLHLSMAAANLAAYGLHADEKEIDLTTAPPPDSDALWFDPARRVEAGGRVFTVRNYQPPLALIHPWRARTPAIGAKLSPGVALAELSDFDCEIEFISHHGDLKECVMWFGPLATAARRATLLPGSHTLVAPSPPPPVVLSLPKAYLYEPDAAILRAGLVTTVAAQLGATQIDADIAYLTGDTLQPSPFAKAFAVEAAMPFSEKRLREKLRAMNVGRITVKKRGSPLDPVVFTRALKLTGDEERIVFLTHVQGRAWALIGQAAQT